MRIYGSQEAHQQLLMPGHDKASRGNDMRGNKKKGKERMKDRVQGFGEGLIAIRLR